MNKEICDYYEAKRRNDKLCKYFTGREGNYYDEDRCRHHCTIMESKRLMTDVDSYKRVRGALRQR